MEKDIKKTTKVFMLPDYEEEEQYLAAMHKEGWRLKKCRGCSYTFERCTPEDVVYRLDFNMEKKANMEDYLSMYRDYGWEYIQDMNDYSYFRKSAAGVTQEDLEIFCDNASRLAMMERIIKAKLLPLLCIFLLITPNVIYLMMRHISSSFASGMLVGFWSAIVVLYVYIFVRCFSGFARLKKKYGDQ